MSSTPPHPCGCDSDGLSSREKNIHSSPPSRKEFFGCGGKEKTAKSHILLIENDEFLGSIYEKNLLMEGFKVSLAVTGERGLKIAETKSPDLILLAVLLPKVNGFEVLENLKNGKATKNIPVVMLTKLGSKEDVQKGQNLGAHDYLIKGHFRPSELVDKVKRILLL